MFAELKGVKVIRPKRGASEYHYAYAGGPLIWRTGAPNPPGSVAYLRAFFGALSERRTAKAVRKQNEMTVQSVLRWYYASEEFSSKPPQTQSRYQSGLSDIDAEFGGSPFSAIADPAIHALLLTWIESNWPGKAGDRRRVPLKALRVWARSHCAMTEEDAAKRWLEENR